MIGNELGGRNVLLLEDDDDTREALTLGFELAGAHVHPCAFVCQARRALTQERFDLMVSDIQLADGDGMSLMREVRQFPNSSGRMPAIAITAYSLSDDAHETLAAGFQRFFRKPLDTHLLIDAMGDLAGQGPVDRRQTERRERMRARTADRRTDH